MPSRAQHLDMLEEPAAKRGIDPGHRLVEQNEPRLGHQRARQFQELALPAGQCAGIVRGLPCRSESCNSKNARSRISRSRRRAVAGRIASCTRLSPG